MTIVPLMVLADRISAPKNTGTVPATAITSMAILPLLMVAKCFLPRSMISSLEKDEKVLSIVDAAEVIMMRFINSITTVPNNLLTSTVACPSRPRNFAKMPMKENKSMQVKPIKVANE